MRWGDAKALGLLARVAHGSALPAVLLLQETHVLTGALAMFATLVASLLFVAGSHLAYVDAVERRRAEARRRREGR